MSGRLGSDQRAGWPWGDGEQATENRGLEMPRERRRGDGPAENPASVWHHVAHTRHRDLRSKGRREGRDRLDFSALPFDRGLGGHSRPGRTLFFLFFYFLHPLIKRRRAAAGLYIVPTTCPVSPPSISALPQRAEPDIYAPSSCSVLEMSPVHSLLGARRDQGVRVPRHSQRGGKEARELPCKDAVQKFSLCSRK